MWSHWELLSRDEKRACFWFSVGIVLAVSGVMLWTYAIILASK